MVTQGLWVTIRTLRLAMIDVGLLEHFEQRRETDWTGRFAHLCVV